jgi:hypothetical protein
MWILFGTHYNTVENEPYVYFIGIFDNIELANNQRDNLIKETKSMPSDYFIKEVTSNELYTCGWSNCSDV